MDVSPSLVAVVAVVFLLAGFVKGVIGLGLPTISVGLLSLVMAPAHAAALLIIPSTITNIQQMRPVRSLVPLSKRLWPMMLGIVVGTMGGGGWIGGPNAKVAAALLGVALVIYGTVGLAQVRFHVARNHEAWLGPLVGTVTGLITAATGVFVIPAVPYLQAVGLEKDELVQGLGLSFFVSTLALAITLATLPMPLNGLLWAAVGTLVPTLVGQIVGQNVRACIDPITFRRWFFVGLFALGCVLIAKWLLA